MKEKEKEKKGITTSIGANHNKVSLSLRVASPVLARQYLSLTLMLLTFDPDFSSRYCTL